MVFSGRHPFTDHASAATDCTRAWDIRSVATHEIGHLLGLGHSARVEATMFPAMAACDPSPATLDPDDRDGAALLYPVPGFSYDIRRNAVSTLPIDPAFLFPLPLWRLGVTLPWTDTNGAVVTDTSRPLILYQVEPLSVVYAVKDGQALTVHRGR